MAQRIPFEEDLPLSLAVVADGRVATIAGQVAPPGAPANVYDQTQLALASLDRALACLGVDRSAVIRCLCFLADIADWAEFNRAYGEFFTDRHPTRTTVGASLQPGLLVEIEALVELP